MGERSIREVKFLGLGTLKTTDKLSEHFSGDLCPILADA